MSNYLSLPGTSGHNTSTPDTAVLDITGDIEIIVRLQDDDHSNEARGASKYGFNSHGYQFGYHVSGDINLNWYDGFSNITAQSTVVSPIAEGSLGWIRITLDVDNGASGYDATFYTSTDDTNDPSEVSWSQLGGVVTGGSTTSIAAGSNDLYGGARPPGTGNLLNGRLYRAQVYNGIGGTLVADFNADDFNVGDSDGATAVDSTGLTWTINGASSTIQSEFGPQAILLLGVG